MAEGVKSNEQTISTDKSFKFWDSKHCSRFLKEHGENQAERRKMLCPSHHRMSRKKGFVRRRQILKIQRIMGDISHNSTQIIYDPDDSIDVKEFIQYPSDMTDPNSSDTNQNTEDNTQKCIEVKMEEMTNYNEINMGESTKYNILRIDNPKTYTVKRRPQEEYNELQTEQLQNCKRMSTKQPRNYKKVKIVQCQNNITVKEKLLEEYDEIETEQLQNCTKAKLAKQEEYKEGKVSKRVDWKLIQAEKCRRMKSKLENRYIVDIPHILSEIHRTFDDHSQGIECHFKDWKLINICRYGLLTKFFFKCQMCKYEDSIFSEPKVAKELDVNAAATTGILGLGLGFTHLNRFFQSLNIYCMSEKTFVKYRDSRKINPVIEKQTASNCHDSDNK